MDFDNSAKNIEISKFQRTVQVLIIILFVPIFLVSLLSIYIYSSTKSNSDLPSGFGLHVIVVPEEIDEFTANQKIIVKEVDTSTIKVNDYVAFYVATDEPTEIGSEVAFKKVLEILEVDDVKRFLFANEEYYQIENSVIGIYDGQSGFTIGVLSFFSTTLSIIIFALLPLIFILLLLSLFIIEQFSVNRLDKDIQFALSKAESAGFDVDLDNNEQPLTQKEDIKPLPVLPPKKAPVMDRKPMPPRKAPEKIEPKPVNVTEKTHLPKLPPKKAPNPNLPPKKNK